MSVGLEYYLILSAALFSTGLYGALAKKNAIVILMCIEIMLNAANIALVAFSRFSTPAQMSGQLLVIFSIVVAAAEVSVGLAIIIAIFRHYKDINVSRINLLKW